MTEINKVKTLIAPELMEDIFEFDLRSQFKYNCSIPQTERNGIETTSSTGPKLQDEVPAEIKKFKFLEEFKG